MNMGVKTNYGYSSEFFKPKMEIDQECLDPAVCSRKNHNILLYVEYVH